MRIGATCLKRCLLLFAILCVLASTAVGGRIVQLPAVTLTPSSSNLVLAPPECDVCGPSKSLVVELSANTQNFRKGSLLYSYSITGGRITGEGNKVSWDLTALSAGTYTATVEVETINPRQSATASTSVTITNCSCDRRRPDPTINVSCPMTPSCTDPVSFDVSISNVPEGANLTYKWVVAGGTITSGQGTTSILVQLEKNYGSVTATVEVGGLDPPM
jgi:hypothetical protein